MGRRRGEKGEAGGGDGDKGGGGGEKGRGEMGIEITICWIPVLSGILMQEVCTHLLQTPVSQVSMERKWYCTMRYDLETYWYES